MTRSLLVAILSLSLPLALAADGCASGGVDCPAASLGRTLRPLATAYATIKTITPRGAPQETVPSAALGPPLAASEPPAATSTLKTAPTEPAYPANPPKPGAGESVQKPETAPTAAPPAAPKREPEYETPSQQETPPQRQPPPPQQESPSDYESPLQPEPPVPQSEPKPDYKTGPDYRPRAIRTPRRVRQARAPMYR